MLGWHQDLDAKTPLIIRGPVFVSFAGFCPLASGQLAKVGLKMTRVRGVTISAPLANRAICRVVAPFPQAMSEVVGSWMWAPTRTRLTVAVLVQAARNILGYRGYAETAALAYARKVVPVGASRSLCGFAMRIAL